MWVPSTPHVCDEITHNSDVILSTIATPPWWRYTESEHAESENSHNLMLQLFADRVFRLFASIYDDILLQRSIPPTWRGRDATLS